MQIRVFVYGTLLADQTNHHRLANSVRVFAQASVDGTLYDVGCGYPALVLSGQGKVFGEVYEVSEEVLHSLDALEGYYGEADEGNYYDRIEVEVTSGDLTARALTYVFSASQARALEVIESGDWRKYREEGY
jgi:gamma-glutamylcyclotransferase (GGCT)/AIG2-like uncharacterized protein YtfP